MYNLAIDPGKHSLACSYFGQDGILKHAELLKVDGGKPWRAGPIGWQLRVRIGKLGVLISKARIEKPQPYQLHSQKGSQFDLHELSRVVGACEALLFDLDVEVDTVFPGEWKGNIPKDVSARRVQACLSPEEWSRIEWPALRLRHNVIDAIHLGLREFTKRRA